MFYHENEPRSNVRLDFTRMNATKCALTHYSNLLTLKFFIQGERDAREKVSLLKESETCEKKIAWWSHQANFDKSEFNNLCIAEKKKWSM